MNTKKLSIKQRLLEIQTKLKAPKGQYNSFGGYKYRSCEDILEAVKPLLLELNCSLILQDSVLLIGERYYVRATAYLTAADIEGATIENTAYAREDDTKKGIDGSQLTGTASSYARKYALNGLFLIDDTKDADTDEHAKQTGKQPENAEEKKATPKQIELIRKIAEEQGKKIDEEKLAGWSMKQASDFISKAKGAK